MNQLANLFTHFSSNIPKSKWSEISYPLSFYSSTLIPTCQQSPCYYLFLFLPRNFKKKLIPKRNINENSIKSSQLWKSKFWAITFSSGNHPLHFKRESAVRDCSHLISISSHHCEFHLLLTLRLQSACRIFFRKISVRLRFQMLWLCAGKKKREKERKKRNKHTSKGLHSGKKGDGKDGIWSWYLIFHTAICYQNKSAWAFQRSNCFRSQSAAHTPSVTVSPSLCLLCLTDKNCSL